MRKQRSKFLPLVLFLLLGINLLIPFHPSAVLASDSGKIHFLTVDDNCLCVLVECNGQFGMIDSGDDSEYPDGSDPRYPDRPGITKNAFYDNDVIAYMMSVGVTSDNFEFYIGTHAHSDHIGSADKIIHTFHPKRVYTQEYKDSYISDSNGLWDNLYIYDNMIAAAKDVDASIILNYDPNAPWYPEQISLSGSIFWEDMQNADGIRPQQVTVHLTDPATGLINSMDVSPDDSGQWNFVFTPLAKFDNAKVPIAYSIFLDVPEGYHVVPMENNQFLCVQNEPVLSLPEHDSAYPENFSLDENYVPLTFYRESQAVAATVSHSASQSVYERQIGRFDTITSEQNTIACPDFTLGSSMNISIKNYGGDFQTNPKPDANYFSLGVLIESNGQRAFIAGDINNFEGNETRLAQELGHVDLLCLGHHGYYGSNTYSYLNALSPNVMVMPGDYTAVSNITAPNGEIGTLDTLLEMGRKNVPLYPTVWYRDLVPAITFEMNPSLTNNIPPNLTFVGASDAPVPPARIFYKDGIPVPYTGWYSSSNGTYYFDNSIHAVADRWFEMPDGSWYYFYPDGNYVKNDWAYIDNSYYYFDADGRMYTGWINLENSWYYCNLDGRMIDFGWCWINGSCYYFYPSGEMAADTWIDGFYVNTSGTWVPNAPSYYDRWCQTDGRWWYRHANGSYTRSDWEYINGVWYYFDASGWMYTGWLGINGQWFYLNPDGSMMTQGWHWIDNQCYYMFSNGVMAANRWIGDFYVDASGAWVPNALRSNEWIKSGEKWWYRHADGSYTTSDWEKINGLWYYFDPNGWMLTGWLGINGQWFYLNPDGSMMTQGWHWIDNKCYYMFSNGVMAANGWIGDFYVDASGAWVPNALRPNEWIKSGEKWWYRHADGSYTTSDWEKINGLWYYFDPNGWMLTGWLGINGQWFYLNPDGSMMTQGWHWIDNKCYYMFSNGVMAANTWIDGFYVNASGEWVSLV